MYKWLEVEALPDRQFEMKDGKPVMVRSIPQQKIKLLIRDEHYEEVKEFVLKWTKPLNKLHIHLKKMGYDVYTSKEAKEIGRQLKKDKIANRKNGSTVSEML